MGKNACKTTDPLNHNFDYCLLTNDFWSHRSLHKCRFRRIESLTLAVRVPKLQQVLRSGRPHALLISRIAVERSIARKELTGENVNMSFEKNFFSIGWKHGAAVHTANKKKILRNFNKLTPTVLLLHAKRIRIKSAVLSHFINFLHAFIEITWLVFNGGSQISES